MNRYPHVLQFVTSQPWAIRRETLDEMLSILRFRSEGGVFDPDEIRARVDAARSGPREGARGGAVAVIPMYGIISQRASLMSDMSGGMSLEAFMGAFRDALNDPDVKGIVIDADSPGGSVSGIEEAATEIRNARGLKPIVFVVNTMMASAAYHLGAQADEIVASPSSLTGSIGVYSVHEDWSKADEIAGLKRTYVSAGKYKVEGNPDEPLSDDGRAATQQMVDDYYAMFVKAVARGRGVSAATVRDGYGEGRVLTAKRALDAGMVDRIGTLDEAIARVASGRVKATPAATAALTSDEVHAAFNLDAATFDVEWSRADGFVVTECTGVSASPVLPDPLPETLTPELRAIAERQLEIAKARARTHR